MPKNDNLVRPIKQLQVSDVSPYILSAVNPHANMARMEQAPSCKLTEAINLND